jgi:asparagine synthetase B (glutamine-hydrolysing)
MYRGSVKSAASSAIDEICIKLRSLTEGAVKRNLADCIPLSEGLDSSILALVASKFSL